MAAVDLAPEARYMDVRTSCGVETVDSAGEVIKVPYIPYLHH